MAVSKFLDPKNDIAFKKIFGSEKNKDILIHFINDIMGFKDAEQIQDVTFLSPVQDPDIAYKKQSLVDVLCKAQNGTQIIVEMQVSPSKGFEKRAQYYAAKAYSRQLSQGQKQDGLYANLKEVIFIAISDYIIFPDKADYISHHVILDKITFEHDLKDFSFSFIELPKFNIDKIEDLKTITEKWCYFFKYAANTSEADLQKIIGSDLVVGRAYEALNQFNWNEAELLAYEQEIKRIMDNKAVEDFMIESAEARGEARGMQIGKAEGKYNKSIEVAKNMLAADSDPDFISQVTGLSTIEINKLKNE
ncbi:hypothetical protein RPR_p14 (plasmid) [Rickettsia peacockii str. Rustic]|uniref:Transposase n=1 Tax=Rickettsia peacockii (strain Rustic) TaxID=562019 RepID=C4K305_RICPU|nr:Rpn family recombination-promoting nuclease/putative transposase [Rickettsia peacockii]ACR47958.1 hypothetical protein RPR_p14 [Rickettsia peacockii str. Rustic]